MENFPTSPSPEKQSTKKPDDEKPKKPNWLQRAKGAFSEKAGEKYVQDLADYVEKQENYEKRQAEAEALKEMSEQAKGDIDAGMEETEALLEEDEKIVKNLAPDVADEVKENIQELTLEAKTAADEALKEINGSENISEEKAWESSDPEINKQVETMTSEEIDSIIEDFSPENKAVTERLKAAGISNVEIVKTFLLANKENSNLKDYVMKKAPELYPVLAGKKEEMEKMTADLNEFIDSENEEEAAEEGEDFDPIVEQTQTIYKQLQANGINADPLTINSIRKKIDEWNRNDHKDYFNDKHQILEAYKQVTNPNTNKTSLAA